MFCHHCGTALRADANFCTRCGHPVTPEQKNTEPAETPTLPEQEIPSHQPDEDMKLFVAENQDYYQDKWSRISGFGISFNLPACFTSFFWMGYRKMYSQIAVYAITLLILEILYGFLDKRLSLVFYIVYFLVIGWIGNFLYKKHAKSQITRIRAMDQTEEQKEQRIKKRGGTNGLGILYAAFIMFAVYVIPSASFHLIGGMANDTSTLPVSDPVPLEEEDAPPANSDADSLIEAITEEALDIPFHEANYEEKVVLLLYDYSYAAATMQDRTEELQSNPVMFNDPEWLSDMSDTLMEIEDAMYDIQDLNEVPTEHENSHYELLDFANATLAVTQSYRGTIDYRDEARMAETVQAYAYSEDLFFDYLESFENELQEKYNNQ